MSCMKGKRLIFCKKLKFVSMENSSKIEFKWIDDTIHLPFEYVCFYKSKYKYEHINF